MCYDASHVPRCTSCASNVLHAPVCTLHASFHHFGYSMMHFGISLVCWLDDLSIYPSSSQSQVNKDYKMQTWKFKWICYKFECLDLFMIKCKWNVIIMQLSMWIRWNQALGAKTSTNELVNSRIKWNMWYYKWYIEDKLEIDGSYVGMFEMLY